MLHRTRSCAISHGTTIALARIKPRTEHWSIVRISNIEPIGNLPQQWPTSRCIDKAPANGFICAMHCVQPGDYLAIWSLRVQACLELFDRSSVRRRRKGRRGNVNDPQLPALAIETFE